MRKKVVIDSGPLIALFDRNDRYHAKALSYIRSFTGTLLSNHAVLTEVTHLLDFNTRTQIDFLRWVSNGAITLADITQSDLSRIITLSEKYADLPMDFTDASLVALCEREKVHDIASVDSDFSIYRLAGKKMLRNVFLSDEVIAKPRYSP